MLERFRIWKAAIWPGSKPPWIEPEPSRKGPRISLGKITFSDGKPVELRAGQILLLTGPNNVGKSACLREVRDHLLKRRAAGPVLKDIEVIRHGTIEEFRDEIYRASQRIEEGLFASFGGSKYAIYQMEDHFDKGFVGERPMSLFLSYLGATERLALSEPARRVDYDEGTRHPLHKLDLDEELEAHVRAIFFDAFGEYLVLNTLTGEKLHLNVVSEANGPPPNNKADCAKWLRDMPRLEDQGDGVRSFVGFVLSLLAQQANIVLIDEPEAFLHPPQVRRLADVIKDNISADSQILIATHSDEMVRALLDGSTDRVVIARLTREKNKNHLRVLEPSQVAELWRDPVLRVSDILSALFHEAAILCEGDSDARFYGALLAGTKTNERDADTKFYSFGGKDRLASVVKALKPLGVPLVVIVDIDLLQEPKKFLSLFEALGGKTSSAVDHLKTLNRLVAQRKTQIRGLELATALHRLATEIESEGDVSAVKRAELGELARVPSPWTQIKAVGWKAFVDSESINAFNRVRELSLALGLLIVKEGELEGFCRSISRTRKSDWLGEVLQRDFRTDISLDDARSFASEIRTAVKAQAGR